MILELLAWILGAYLVAGIPVGLLIGRLQGVDLREIGSGNIGATNAIRALGKKWGLIVFLLDVAKAALPVLAATARFGDTDGGLGGSHAISLVALFAILGHVFPVYLRFRGGKGVACALGVFLVLAPKAALVGLVVYLQLLWLTRVSALGSLSAALVIIGVVWADPGVARPYLLLAVGLGGLIWERHRDNLAQILSSARAAGERSSEP